MSFALYAAMAFWGINFVLLYNRRSAWTKNNYKWYAVSMLFIIGLASSFYYKSVSYEVYILFVAMMTPACFSLIDYGFEWLSVLIQKRDFYLWVRGSDDLNDNEIQIKGFDRVLSMLLVFITIGIPALPALLLLAIRNSL